MSPKGIANLVQSKLAGRKIDVVGFIDALLAITVDVGEIRCCMSQEGRLLFMQGDEVIEKIELDSCRGKLRMLCARLSVLCDTPAGVTLSPYGGEGVIGKAAHNGSEAQAWRIEFKNSPDEQEFTIIPCHVISPTVSRN